MRARQMTNDKWKTTNGKCSFQAVRFITAQRKVLAQRVSLPIVRQQNTTQIRMVVENDAKQIERLAFVPVRGLPDAGHGFEVSIFLVQQDFDSHAMVLRSREEVIVHFETWL